jgi:glycine betaine/proline transport system substrate-binding protein
MSQGARSQRDIERHVDGWIKFHQQLFDSWIDRALTAESRAERALAGLR